MRITETCVVRRAAIFLGVSLVTVAVIAADDASQPGFTSQRNNVAPQVDVPSSWSDTKRVKWSTSLGTRTNGSPVVAGGKVFIGTNNGAAYLDRFPRDVDLGVLLCFEEATGRLLWQYSCAKLPTGKQHDFPEMGICSTPLVEGDRLWFVSSRGEVVCLDTEGFRDKKNDGPVVDEAVADIDEGDVVWRLDMMRELGVQQHNMANCSVTTAGNTLLVCTSNGIDRAHQKVAAPGAPSFLGIDKMTGRVVWTDNSPGENVLHGQWSSPAVAVVGDTTQAIFAGGDGWLYSFDARGNGQGGARLLWKFDCNPKISRWGWGGRFERNNIIANPVIHKDRVYVATGQSPDRGVGRGRLWCVDASSRVDGSDVSDELAIGADDRVLPRRRVQAVDRSLGETIRPNPTTAARWCYTSGDWNGDGKLTHCEQMHRAISSPVVNDRMVVAVDTSGVVHCLDARSGKAHWTYDTMAEVWASPLIIGNRVIVADTDGTISIFHLASDPQKAMVQSDDKWSPIVRWEFDCPIHSTPTVSAGVLYIATQRKLFVLDLSRQCD